MTRVTWLLPVRDGMPYLPQTLESIAGQTYRDWQVLAWDNGSTDGTLEELRQWIPGRIPGRIVSDRPLPLGACLAAMVEECGTELCARIDADDINLPDRLERQIAFLDSAPDVAAVGSATERIDARGCCHGIFHAFPSGHFDILSRMLAENAIAHPTVMFRRAAVLEAGNYSDLKPIEDYELWHRLALGSRLANLPEALVQYRVHRRGVTQQAIASGELYAAIAAHCSHCAPSLYGCSEGELRLLRAERHHMAVIPLLRIARHLGKQRGLAPAAQMRDPELLYAAQRLLAPWDLVSACALGALDPRVGLAAGLKASLVRGATVLWSKTPMLHGLLTALRERSWRNELRKRGSIVDRTVQIAAARRPLERIAIGAGVHLERDITIWLSEDDGADARLDVGDRVYVGRNTYLGAYAPIRIGAHAIIGAYSYLISASHRFDRRDVPIRDQGYAGAPIVIEDDVWIGTHVTVLPGVTIGRGAIVGAGSLVNKDIPAYEIWGGTPARFLKERPDPAS